MHRINIIPLITNNKVRFMLGGEKSPSFLVKLFERERERKRKGKRGKGRERYEDLNVRVYIYE